MNDYAGARLAARKRWDKACWDVRTAELRHGIGSVEWQAAAKREYAAQQEYASAAGLERAHAPY